MNISLTYFITYKIESADFSTYNLFKDVELAFFQVENDSVESRNSQVLAGSSVVSARVKWNDLSNRVIVVSIF